MKYGTSQEKWLSTLHKMMRVQYDWNWRAAVCDYIGTAITLPVLVYRMDKDKSLFMFFVTLALPNVGLPLFLGRYYCKETHKD